MTILGAFSLDGNVAIVTAASSGLGVAFATGLAEASADILRPPRGPAAGDARAGRDARAALLGSATTSDGPVLSGDSRPQAEPLFRP